MNLSSWNSFVNHFHTSYHIMWSAIQVRIQVQYYAIHSESQLLVEKNIQKAFVTLPTKMISVEWFSVECRKQGSSIVNSRRPDLQDSRFWETTELSLYLICDCAILACSLNLCHLSTIAKHLDKGMDCVLLILSCIYRRYIVT